MTGAGAPRDELITHARAGDRVALERLLAVCRPDLERYARRHCDSDDVQEAVQDALWIVFRRVGGLRDVAAFTGWLFQVVRRACLGYARRRRPHVALDAIPDAADRAACDVELRVALSGVIAGLPPAYREVLLLKDVQGWTVEEISAETSASCDAVKSRLHRARAMVRAALLPA